MIGGKSADAELVHVLAGSTLRRDHRSGT